MYFLFQTHVDKGKSVLLDAKQLAESFDADEVSEVTEVAQQLRTNMKSFTSDLDLIRDRIETSGQCYKLLDNVSINHLVLETRGFEDKLPKLMCS